MTDQEKLWLVSRKLKDDSGSPACWIIADVIGCAYTTVNAVMVGTIRSLPNDASRELDYWLSLLKTEDKPLATRKEKSA